MTLPEQALAPKSPVASPPAAAQSVLHVNSFDVKYRDDGSVEQFVSDLSVYDPQGRERLRKSISVNDPLRFRVRPARHQVTLPFLHPSVMAAAMLGNFCIASSCGGCDS